MAEPIRPVWRDRVYGGSGQATFDITSPYLPQLTPVKQEGTFHNSGRMNNLFVFDNLIAMSGAEYLCDGLTLKTSRVTETLTEAVPDEDTGEKRLLARRITEKNNNVWTVTEELFDLNEFNQNIVVQKRIMTQKAGAQGAWEGAVV